MSTDLNNAVHRLRQDRYPNDQDGRNTRQADIEQLSHALGLAENTIDQLVGDLAKEVNGPTFMGEPAPPHPDDVAVDRFARALKLKLAAARDKGRDGWSNDEPGMQQRLSDMLRMHVEKGDPRDVANFCMFLHQRGEGISPADQAPAATTQTVRPAYGRYAIACICGAVEKDDCTCIQAAQSDAPRPSMQFTLGQAETLLAFFGGSNGDMTVEYFPANHWPDSPEAPAGLYVYCTEYPEEGAQWLGREDNSDEIEPTWQHIPAESATHSEATLESAVHAYKVACVARMAMQTDPDGTPTVEVLNAAIREGVRAVLQVTAPAAVPPGCIVVPAEPTEEMLTACIEAWQHRLLKKAENGKLLAGGNPRESFRENYKAMVAAALLSGNGTEVSHE